MQIKNNLLDFFKACGHVFSILLGFAFVLLILWNRLLRERFPYILDGNYTFIQLVLTIDLFIIFIFLSLYYLRKVLNIKIKENGLISQLLKIPLVETFVDFWYKYILNAPLNAYEFLYRYIRVADFVERLGARIYHIDPYKYPFHTYCFITSFRLVISLVFIRDVFYLHRLDLFYTVLNLLIIPLIINFFIFMIGHCSKQNRVYIEKNYINIESNETKDGFIVDPLAGVDLTEEKCLVWGNTWLFYTANAMFVDKIDEYKNKYDKYINFVFYSVYACGWGYIAMQYYI